MFYEVVPVNGGMIGGHYQIKTPDGRLLFSEIGLDMSKANKVANELNRALKSGSQAKALEGMDR